MKGEINVWENGNAITTTATALSSQQLHGEIRIGSEFKGKTIGIPNLLGLKNRVERFL
jgi:hypothetical protein